jgi:hypothetical protein
MTSRGPSGSTCRPGRDLEGAPPYWAAIGSSSRASRGGARPHLAQHLARRPRPRRDGGDGLRVHDARFDTAGSVQANRVGAVICAAIGGDAEQGVLYIQGARGGGGLHRDAARLVGATARAIAPTIAREVARARLRAATEASDATARIRARFPCAELIGRSPALAQALELASLAARPTAPCCSRAHRARESRCWRGPSRAAGHAETRPSWSSTAPRCRAS